MSATPADYAPLNPAQDPIVLRHKTLLARLEAQLAQLSEQVARRKHLVAQLAITRPFWWNTPPATPQRRKATRKASK